MFQFIIKPVFYEEIYLEYRAFTGKLLAKFYMASIY